MHTSGVSYADVLFTKLCVLIACATVAVPVLAAEDQPSGNGWKGTLRDAHGVAVAGAVIRLRFAGTKASATTRSNGQFAFAALPAGDYSVSVDYKGSTVTCSMPLRLPGSGSVAVLELSAEGALSLLAGKETRAGTGGEQLSAKAVSAMPLNKRDFSQLLLLAAGTMTDTNGASNFTQQFAVNGQRGTAAVFAMDGADSTDPEMGGATFTNFNVDAVQEIRSSSGWMPAEIGRGAAGFTDIITKSGANLVHGSAFEFLRNAALDARNFFDYRTLASSSRIPPFIRNEFGLTAGGPLTIPHVYGGHNRTFFFAEYQGFRQVLSDTEVLPVPTAAERQGFDTTAYAGDTLIVPVDPRIATVLARYPLPNDAQGPYGARTWAGSSKVTTVADQFSARIDHNLSDKSKLFGRFTMADNTGPDTNPDQTALSHEFAVGFLDRQRNAVITLARTPSPTTTQEYSISFTRTTPSFPTPDRTDPSLVFGDGLYEAFNAAGGSVMAEYGNLFQARTNLTRIRGKHTFKTGGEVRSNRDTTLFGLNPNGQYQFGGGVAYSPAAIRSLSGTHDIQVGDPLPDTLTGLLTASAFTYTIAVAPPMFAQGDSIGDSAIHRDSYNAYFQDSWKVTDRLTLNYGLRYEITSPIREEEKRTSAPMLSGGTGPPGSELIVNPRPGYNLDRNGWGPRLGVDWRVASNTTVHVGAAITTLLVNLWQDNSLTGSTPFVVYPRLTAAPGQSIRYGMTITPQQLPSVYTPDGKLVFASGDSKQVAPNTLMDVLRFEQDLAAISPDHQITPLSVGGIAPNFSGGYVGTWTAGIEHKVRGVTLNGAYVGTAGIKLPSMDFPNGFSGADPAFAPYTQFDSSGLVTGGYGPVAEITNRSHSTYHALQLSAQNNLTAFGLGFQASYTHSKSLDDTSAVIGGFISGSSGAVAQTAPMNPFDPALDKGPSGFDIKDAASFSLFQDLHADSVRLLRPLGKTLTRGWQLLGIGTFLTGLPFTIYSGVQQTGVGAGGTDRPDQIGVPDLSTSRTIREDYFGLGADNASLFSVPIHVPGGTGPNDGRFGTLGRNTFRGPGFHNADVALIKDTPVGKRGAAELGTIQFRAEFFNLFNIVNFGLPANTVTGPGFGMISRTAGSSRQIQFSLKLIF
jgi:hypothetical protein